MSWVDSVGLVVLLGALWWVSRQSRRATFVLVAALIAAVGLAGQIVVAWILARSPLAGDPSRLPWQFLLQYRSAPFRSALLIFCLCAWALAWPGPARHVSWLGVLAVLGFAVEGALMFGAGPTAYAAQQVHAIAALLTVLFLLAAGIAVLIGVDPLLSNKRIERTPQAATLAP
jgi:hypothetical protein